jgi:PleD family two-component response regulator
MAFNHQSLPNATDVAIRFGGKDFSVLLPNTRPKDAIDISERMCQKIMT